ncbi:MAG: ATPase [Rhodospirillum sp.]|nr:ATPase [Rhodospirillum sp.]
MPLTAISIHGYRSIPNLYLQVEPCSVFVGENGVGKSNLYKALGLLRAAAEGTITRAIAEEGGVESVLWAGGGRMRREPVRLILKADIDHLHYEVEIGLPSPAQAGFRIEPLIKEERIIATVAKRKVTMLERMGPVVNLRNADGAREMHKDSVLSSETALVAFRDGARYPEIEMIRQEMLDWRLYHDFRTDESSPIRQPCHAIATPTLSADGHDLAAVLGTLFIIRQETTELQRAFADAFPGTFLSAGDHGSWCEIAVRYPDFQRPFGAHELSDGTLKYLCLLGALMGYRLPSLIALNEPEASLHPALLPPLARLIAQAAQRTRIWIVTHSEALAAALHEETGKKPRRVIKEDGATNIEGLTLSGEFRDEKD